MKRSAMFNPQPEDIVLDASFRDFHTKGFDYLCIKRSEELTLKIYFFDGNLADLPELVVPHDHRYNFFSSVITGSVANKKWREVKNPELWPEGLTRFNKMEWRSPLLGGEGFSWDGEVMLRSASDISYTPGNRWYTHHSEIHTLRIERGGTILLLEQLQDVVPLDQPTSAYKRDIKGVDPTLPDISGLYERMTEEYAIERLLQYRRGLRSLGVLIEEGFSA